MISLEFTTSVLGLTRVSGTAEEISELLHLLTAHDAMASLEKNGDIRENTSISVQSPARATKRQLVLNVMSTLSDMGVIAPKTAQIIEIYRQTYPDQDASNIDQVLRDLANKTDLVIREKWGCFTLKEP